MVKVHKILIVGGGTAGWLSAAYLAKHLGASSPHGVQIELVESPAIAASVVGESAFPSLRGTLAAIGLDERRFMRGADATFKQGIQFMHWVRPPGGTGRDRYFHPFCLPSHRNGAPELLPYWLLGAAAPGMPLADAVTTQCRVVRAMRAPKRPGDGSYLGAMNYAYHFDAARFAQVLAEHACGLGVQRRQATVAQVRLTASGDIDAVVTDEAGELRADLYLDCTGQRARLIGEALGSPFTRRNDALFVDRALAMQVPYEAAAAMPPYTVATAQEAGWSWDIALRERRGVGYVYSSGHSSDDRAEVVLRQHLGPVANGIEARLLRFESGYRAQPWRRNCVAVGLSSGFVEPLESNGIALIEFACYLLAHLFPADGDFSRIAPRFNALLAARYERLIDFIKMHYCLSRRRDHRFWEDNTDPASVPQTLQDLLATWRCRPPHRLDFVTDTDMFTPASWQYVLYGMEYPTDLAPMHAAFPRLDEARREFGLIRQVAEHAVGELPPHREMVEFMCRADPSRSAA